MSTQLVAMQTLKSVETDIHFESEEFMIPDLTEAEIYASFTDPDEMEIALMKSTSGPTFGPEPTRYTDSNAEDK